jgi:transposase
MLIVGFFENIGSERGIATRCADSISLRRFLKYDLTENTPDHSSLSRIRTRLETKVYEEGFTIVLEVLQKNKLLKGKHLGIDTSVIEANGSMRTLVNNHTRETYDEYVKRLAAAAGINTEDKQAVRDFDRKREDKKMSNDDWHSPNDPEAKIGPTKQGDIKMLHKTENIVDLDTGAILKASILPGDQSDDRDMSEHIQQAQDQINAVSHNAPNQKTVKVVTGDKGYFNISELQKLQAEGIRTVVQDKSMNRRLDKLNPEQRKAVKSARRSVKTKYGQKVRKRRGEFLERSFTHVLDNGDLRRTTLSGTTNVNKRNLIASMCCNLSLLMRKIYGFGTPKQVIATVSGLQNQVLDQFIAFCRLLKTSYGIWMSFVLSVCTFNVTCFLRHQYTY